MLNLGSDVGLGGFDQVQQSSFRCVWQSTAFAGPHRHPKLRSIASHLGPFSNALVARIAVNNMLIAMEQLSDWGEVVHIGGRDHHRMDQT